MLSSQGLLIKSTEGFFDILKSDDLIIGGYASIEVVDKQNDLITLEALNDAVHKFMGESNYRNVMSNHSNVQVGEVIEQYRDKNGTLHKTAVDDVGFYVVIKLREDIEKAKEISRGIRKGTLRSFSIGGQAISKKSRTNSDLGKYNEIDKLELHEVTICEKGINPEARFDILKQEVGGEKNMSEKLEKALEELNGLMLQVQEIRKEGETAEGASDLEEELDELPTVEGEGDDSAASMDYSKTEGEELEDETTEKKELDEDEARNEAGTIVVDKKPKASTIKLTGYVNEDFSTLNLSHENVEKAYEAFKAEQLEKIAYEDLNKTFAARFEAESEVKKEDAEKAAYDARSEVADLKTEFAELRKSLTEKDEEIRKNVEVAFSVPENFPTNIDEAAEMSWSDIHNLVGGV